MNGSSRPPAAHVLDDDVDQALLVTRRFAAGMRRDEDVGQVPQRAFGAQGLVDGEVQRCPGDAAALQCCDQLGLVDDLAARHVHQVCGLTHTLQFGRADEIRGFGYKRTAQRDVIGAVEQFPQAVGRQHDVGRSLVRRGVALGADDPHAERLGEGGEAVADGAEADDAQGFFGDLVLTHLRVADHGTPVPAMLIVSRFGQTAAEGQDERHGVFADGVGVDSHGVGQADGAALQFGKRKLVVTDADGLNPFQFPGAIEQAVSPGARNDQHVDLRHAAGDGVGAGFLKNRGFGKPGAEHLSDAIGGVTHAEGQVPGRNWRHEALLVNGAPAC